MTTGSVTGRDPATGNGRRIVWEAGRIVAVEPADDAPPLYVAAGLVDLQVNGYSGHDLNAETLTAGTVSALARAVLATGTTSFLPTLVTAPEERIAAALVAIAAARAADPLVAAMVPGVHLEGPWISPDDGPRGAHPRAHVRPPDLAAFDRWQAASGGLVRLVTLSPHWPGSAEVVRGLVARDVRVAIGHTAASAEAIDAAAAAGATLSTHLGNGIAAELPRHPNILWQQLADDRLTATFIADGHHLSPDTFRAMLRAKGRERAILVSDATSLAGLPPGRYVQPIGGDVELSATGRLSLAGTPYLAGAALPLADMAARAARMAGVGLADALALASDNPARLLGRRARLEPGARADLILFGWTPGDDRLAIARVFLGGTEA